MSTLLQSNFSKLDGVSVFMFHRVVECIPQGPLYDIHYTRENLEKLLKFLRKKGFETVTFEDLLNRDVPRKPVILTFDDGYEDNYIYLFPLLKKYEMKAVIYLLGDRTILSNAWDVPQGAAEAPLMKKEQILEMAESGLVEFGGHSMTHAKLTDLTPGEIELQVYECKSSLERLLGKPVLSFAYPYGFFNRAVKKIVERAGYLFGVVVEWGPNHFCDDLMEIRRVCLSPDAGKFEFYWKTSFLYPAFRRYQKRLKSLMRKAQSRSLGVPS